MLPGSLFYGLATLSPSSARSECPGDTWNLLEMPHKGPSSASGPGPVPPPDCHLQVGAHVLSAALSLPQAGQAPVWLGHTLLPQQEAGLWGRS